MLLADAPLVEGLVAAAVAAQGGADVHAVKRAAEAVYGSATGAPPSSSISAVEEGSVTGAGPEFTGDFELINQAGMHARPAAKIAGGLSSLDARRDRQRRGRDLNDGTDDAGSGKGFGAAR